MRNFHITAAIDGRKTPLSGGPRASDGGFLLEVKIAEEKEPKVAVIVKGRVRPDGRLELQVNLDHRFFQLATACLTPDNVGKNIMPTFYLLERRKNA